jgi:ABC-type transporter Mla MlaB component
LQFLCSVWLVWHIDCEVMCMAHFIKRANRMLKVTMFSEQKVNRLVVEGRLVDPEASELARAWLQARVADPFKTMEVDLADVTYADEGGRDLLATMHRQGVRLVGSGAMTRALIDEASRCDGPRGGTP